MVNVGGYFASLKLMTDEDSFRKGIGILEKFPTSLKTVGVGVVGVAAGMVALATTTANAMAKLDAQAKTLGMNALTLDNWKNAVKLAGGDADSFVGSLMNMNEAFRNLKVGEVKEDFIKATGMSGADFSKLQGMNNDQRLRTIWSALERVSDPSKQQALIQKIFGSAGVDLFSRLQLQGNTLGSMYNQAAAMNPNTQADYETAIKGNELQNSIAVSFENTAKLVGIKIEEALLPYLRDLATWLKENKIGIAEFAATIGNATKFILDSIKGIASWFQEGTKKEEYLKKRGLTGLELTAAQADLLYGVGPEAENYKAVQSGQFTIDEINRMYSTKERKAISGAGFPELAGKSSDAIIAALYQRAMNLNRAEGPAAAFNAQDIKNAVNIYVAVDKAGNVVVGDQPVSRTGNTPYMLAKGIQSANASSGMK